MDLCQILRERKPKALLNFAKKNKINFLALEYSGHGKSSGKFTKGNISKWSDETSKLVKKYAKDHKLIFIGSSTVSYTHLTLPTNSRV